MLPRRLRMERRDCSPAVASPTLAEVQVALEEMIRKRRRGRRQRLVGGPVVRGTMGVCTAQVPAASIRRSKWEASSREARR